MTVSMKRHIAAAALAGLLSSGAATASEPYPAKPVRLVVPFTPGSASDILARSISQRLSARWGQPVVVDNRPGAGGTIGTGLVAKARPDGYTLVVVSAGHIVNPLLYANLPYDTLKDFRGVTPLANLPSVLAVSKELRLSSVRELIALAKAKPGELNYVSGGIGSGSHINAEKFRLATGVATVHVPMKGATDMLTELMSGRAQYGFLPIVAAVSIAREGRIGTLAVSSEHRSPTLPDVPTIAEAGVPGAQFDFWVGVLAPAATPRDIVHKLQRDMSDALKLKDVVTQLAQLGAEPMPMTPEAFDAFIRKEFQTLGPLLKTAGIKAQ